LAYPILKELGKLGELRELGEKNLMDNKGVLKGGFSIKSGCIGII